jgi:formylglycine-generating enzyme required for sulfatase activity
MLRYLLIACVTATLLVAAENETARPQPGQGWTIPGLGLAMVPIPAGSFVMGSPADEPGREEREGPQTRVTLSQPFWLGTTEVTQPQWQAVMETNPSQFKNENHPVEKISWEEATEFCQRLTARERAAGRLPEGYVYALPTEAQWEYACRAGTTGRYAGKFEDVTWHYKNTADAMSPQPVAKKQPNPWGLHDMHGNMAEWCADWYGDYPGGSVSDPTGAKSGTLRIVRGGSWGDAPQDCRSAFRVGYKPDRRGNSIGLRVALRRG